MRLRRSGAGPLLGIVLFAASFLGLVLAEGWSPQLGLDLQGGASVVFRAVPSREGETVTQQDRDDAIAIIRSRVDALGVAEPEIVGQGSDLIVVNLPGIDDQQRALCVVGATAELRFRPVLASGVFIDPNALTETTDTTTVATGDTTDTTTADTADTGDASTTTPTTAGSTTTATTDDATSTSEAALGGIVPGEVAALPLQDDSTTTTATTTPTTEPSTADTETATSSTLGEPGTTTTTAPAALDCDPTDDSTAATDSTDSTGTTAGTDTTADATTTPTTAGPTTTAGDTTSSEGALGGAVAGELAALPFQDDPTTTGSAGGSTTTTAAATTTTSATGDTTGSTDTTLPGDTTTTTAPPLEIGDVPGCYFGGSAVEPLTDAAGDLPEAEVVLALQDAATGAQGTCFRLGPVPTNGSVSLVGSIVQEPEATIASGSWQVSLTIAGDSLDLFNQTALACNTQAPDCATGQLAIVLDGDVRSAPQVNEGGFPDGQLSISGSFTEQEARDLALVLRFGALPVQLEPQTVQTVSATLGRDSLNAGLLAGFIGVAFVAVYMLVYYRGLGVVVLLGLSVWAALNYSIISWLGETQGLALSLSGVTGIVVSVGVTVDSYVVYFERLKDEIRSGRTIRSSVDRGFQRAFRTILTADVSSFIGAALLYFLTVGPVRGFAFFLGLSTILDVVVAYLFTRPLVGTLGRSDFFTRSRVFGVARGLGATETEATA